MSVASRFHDPNSSSYILPGSVGSCRFRWWTFSCFLSGKSIPHTQHSVMPESEVGLSHKAGEVHIAQTSDGGTHFLFPEETSVR